ncbi:MAG: hypothetical protein HXX81_04355 [Campylobacterales bacterium]|nr:hypothetical protein [Campylobacterales bacterium]
MKRFAILLLAVFSTIFILLYILLFTTFGNSVVASLIQSKITSANSDIKLEKFIMNMNNIEMSIVIDNNSKIDINSTYSIFNLSIDGKFNLDIEDLSKLQHLTTQKLNGNLKAHGSLAGNKENMKLNALSDIFGSNTTIDIGLNNFEISEILFDIKDAKIEKLLYMLDKSNFLTGSFNSKGVIKNADIKNLDGVVDLDIKNGYFIASNLLKEFNISIKDDVSFTLNSNSILNKDTISSKLGFNSKLIEFNSNDISLNIEKQLLNLTYDTYIENLAYLKAFMDINLHGNLKANGVINLKKDELEFSCNTNSFGGKSLFESFIDDIKEPTKVSIHSKFENVDIQKLLFVAGINYISNGKINGEIALKNSLKNKLDGVSNILISNLSFDNSMLKQLLDVELPNEHYNIELKSSFMKDIIISIIEINSNILNINANQMSYNLTEQSLKSDFLIDIENLKSFEKLLNMKIDTPIKIVGELENSQTLKIKAKSDIFGGDVKFNLDNSLIDCNLNSIILDELFKALNYPNILKATFDGVVNYNLVNSLGEVKLYSNSGKIEPNQLTTLLKTLANIDLEKEIFNKISLNTKIDKFETLTDINLTSQNSQIYSKDTKFNLSSKYLESNIALSYKDRTLYALVKGDVKNPKVSINANEALKEKATKEIEKVIDKNVKEELKQPIKDILKLFNQ